MDCPYRYMAVRSGVQSGKLHEKVGFAGGCEALVADQYSDQADQNRRTASAPRKEAGISACRGAGDQGNSDRDIGTNQPASAGTWLAHLGSAGIGDGYGVIWGKWATRREPIGQWQAILDFYAWRGDGYPMRVGHFSESDSG